MKISISFVHVVLIMNMSIAYTHDTCAVITMITKGKCKDLVGTICSSLFRYRANNNYR